MAQEAIYKYLCDQNRPFSINDVFENLAKQFGKTEVQKTIDKLVAQDKVLEKTYGKQKVYCVKQSDSGASKSDLDAELRELDKSIADIEQNLEEVEEKLSKNESELKALLSTLTTDEAREEKEKLEEEIEILKQKLDSLTNGGSKASVVITQELRNKIINENEKMAKEYRKRKRICMDIINSIMEGYPKTKKHLIEEVGIETDEDVGFKLD